ncbi:MAG TPA: YbhB/YbcL family Raf kinase inhibitor-like protein [Kofleriaceae bacterium]|nr:YbhB/YbcL family Raf kinase inhibitor-like protein [Kofleriaceae bacterium]
MKHLLVFALIAAGCGGDDAPSVDAPTAGSDAAADGPDIDAPPTGFTLTSPAFNNGGSIPGEQTCTGAGTSPQLDWTNPPANAMSYAVVLTDLTNTAIHWVIWDIPGTATGLPANVENAFQPANVAGAKQAASFNNIRGYVGPCPPPPEEHMYQFAVFAIDVATLPGTSMNTTQVQALQAINMHRISSATLTGRYKQ